MDIATLPGNSGVCRISTSVFITTPPAEESPTFNVAHNVVRAGARTSGPVPFIISVKKNISRFICSSALFLSTTGDLGEGRTWPCTPVSERDMRRNAHPRHTGTQRSTPATVTSEF